MTPEDHLESGEREFVYRVDVPHGSDGWREYEPPRWIGTITTDELGDGPEVAAALVARDLNATWDRHGLPVQHVRICVWEGREGAGPDDADYVVEIQPDLGEIIEDTR